MPKHRPDPAQRLGHDRDLAGGNRLSARRRPGRIGSIGFPLPGIELGIVALDDPHRALGPGETGELRVKGPNVTRGYWNRPQESAASFADGYFLTGDIGYMDEDGYFFIVDRKKDMIISRRLQCLSADDRTGDL